MNEAAYILSLAMVGVMFSAMFLIPLRQGRTLPCPNCKKRFSREFVLLDRIQCPRCNWHAVPPPVTESNSDHPAIHQAGRCACCNVEIADSTQVHLWDGRDYCRRCVAEIGDELPDAGKLPRSLTETIPFTGWTVCRRQFLMLWLVTNALFGSIAVAAGWQDGGVMKALLCLGIIQLLFVPVIAVFAWAAAAGFTSQRSTVIVENGELTVRLGIVKSIKCKLRECEWFLGSSSKTNLYEKSSVPGGDALLIALPMKEEFGELTASVGFTEQTRRLWMAFLTLAGVPRRTEYENRARGTILINVCGGILAVLGPVACFFAVKPVRAALMSLTGDMAIAEMLSFQLFIPGCIFALIYVLSFWPWSARKKVRSNLSAKEVKAAGRKMMWGFGGMALMLAMTYLSFKEHPLPARILATCVAVVATMTAGYDIGRRSAKWEYKKFEDELEQPFWE